MCVLFIYLFKYFFGLVFLGSVLTNNSNRTHNIGSVFNFSVLVSARFFPDRFLSIFTGFSSVSVFFQFFAHPYLNLCRPFNSSIFSYNTKSRPTRQESIFYILFSQKDYYNTVFITIIYKDNYNHPCHGTSRHETSQRTLLIASGSRLLFALAATRFRIVLRIYAILTFYFHKL